MKLYTEEQVRKAIELAQEMDKVPYTDNDYTHRHNEQNIIQSLTPIELPSDDEVCDEAESIAHNYFVMQRNHYQGLDEGAKRMAYWFMKRFKQEDNEK